MDDGILLLVERYCKGECSPSEREALGEWAAADPSRQAELHACINLITRVRAASPRETKAQAGLDRINQLIAETASSIDGARHSTDRATAAARHRGREIGGFPQLWPRMASARMGWRMAAVAAGVLLALGLGIAVGSGRRVGGANVLGREYVTTPGQRETVTLRDGSQFTLAPGSRLRVAADFGVGARRVNLTGEAFFTVVHNERVPFTVEAGNAVMTDIGTTFDVRAYDADRVVQVAVTDGHVSLRSTHMAGALLGAGDLGVVFPTGATSVSHGADVAGLTAWREGRLVFRDTPLDRALTELSRWYGITIMAPAVGARRITATVDQPTPTAALDMLAPAVGARYAVRGDTVILTPLPIHP